MTSCHPENALIVRGVANSYADYASLQDPIWGPRSYLALDGFLASSIGVLARTFEVGLDRPARRHHRTCVMASWLCGLTRDAEPSFSNGNRNRGMADHMRQTIERDATLLNKASCFNRRSYRQDAGLGHFCNVSN